MDRSQPSFSVLGILRRGEWSRLPCPLPGYLPYPGIEPMSFTSPALAGGFFTTSATWEAQFSGDELLQLLLVYEILYLSFNSE